MITPTVNLVTTYRWRILKSFRSYLYLMEMVCECVLSKFNDTSTRRGSYRAKTGDNDSNVNSSRYSLSTALCESIHYQAKSEQNVRQDLIPRVRHVEAELSLKTSISIAENIKLNSAGTRTYPCYTPCVTRNGSKMFPSSITRDIIPAWNCLKLVTNLSE